MLSLGYNRKPDKKILESEGILYKKARKEVEEENKF